MRFLCRRIHDVVYYSLNHTAQRIIVRSAKQYRKRKNDERVVSVWTNVGQSMHIEKPEVADRLIQQLQQDAVMFPTTKHVLEVCPGKGLLTESMLQQTDLSVICLTDKKSDLNRLEELKSKYPDKEMHVHSFTNSLFRHAIVNADVENPLADLMSRLPKRTWTDDPTAFMVIPLTPLSEVSFLRSLFLQVANCSAFFSNGRIVFYAFVSGRELYYMTAKSDEKNLIRYRYCSVLYQTFFDMEVLDKFKWDCFLPEIKHKNIIRNDFDVQHSFLIRLVPKLNLLQQIPSEHLTLFLFFVHQAMMKRTTCIVAFLEKMAPGCGPKLIEMGIPLFQTFGELSPNQFLELFMKLHSWEEFDHLFFESYVHDYTDYQ